VNIPINAKVECTDGSCGRSTNVIVNPVILKLDSSALGALPAMKVRRS
jgi:hypothetical protein